jgi:hypothetical protein
MSHTYDCNSKLTHNPEDCDCGENYKQELPQPPLKFFICPHCASLATSEDITAEVESGGVGLCDCEYMKLEWDYGTQSFEPMYYRVYHDRIEIDKDIYLKFKEESNCVKRLEMFDSVLE